MAERPWHEGRRAQQDESKATLQLRQERLQTTTPHRERLLPPQGLPSDRNTLRQAGQKLPRLDMPRRRRCMMDFMSLDPSIVSLRRAERLPDLRQLETTQVHEHNLWN